MNIQNKMIRCQINTYFTNMLCLYYSKINTQNYFMETIFNIKDMNLNKEKTFEIIWANLNPINQIKLEISNNNKYFVCITNNSIPICFINENSYEYELKEIGCKFYGPTDLRYKIFYLKETNEFILQSKFYLSTTILNNFDNSIKKCIAKNIFSRQPNGYSLIH